MAGAPTYAELINLILSYLKDVLLAQLMEQSLKIKNEYHLYS